MKASDITPLFSRILVKRKVLTSKVLYFPPNAQGMDTTEGEIISIGGEVDTLKPGDNILYGKYAGVPIEITGDDGKYMIMNEVDVIAIIAKEETI